MSISLSNENLNFLVITSNKTRRCKILQLRVARLYVAPNTKEWKFTGWTGFLSLVQDYDRKCFCLRLVDFQSKTLTWEQELYLDFEFKKLTQFFYYFSSDNEWVGILFCHQLDPSALLNQAVAVANRRKKCIKSSNAMETPMPAPTSTSLCNASLNKPHFSPMHQSTIKTREAPSLPPQKKSTCSNLLPPALDTTETVQAQQSIHVNDVKPTFSEKKKEKKGFFKKKKNESTTRVAVSAPVGFRHITHLGSDNLNLDSLPDEWLKALTMVGLSENDLKDENVAAAVSEAMEAHKKIPPRKISRCVSDGRSSKPPHDTVPPPPPSSIPAPPSSIPPPPPLAPPSFKQKTVQPRHSPVQSGEKVLKKSESEPPNLLNQIKSGTSLRKVDTSTSSTPAESNNEVQDMASLLLRVLEDRKNILAGSSSDEGGVSDWSD